MALKLSWAQALTWRMRRQLLEPIGDLPLTEVVARLCGVQAQVASSAELAIRLRQQSSKAGDVGRAIEDGRLIKTWAMRGTLHLLTPEDAGSYLSLMASGRTWELPTWQRYFGLTPKHWELFRPAVREALDGNVLTREQLAAAVVATPGLEHVGKELASGWGTLLKPLAWQGDLVFGPSQGNRVTFVSPSAASSRWGGVPSPDEAAPRAILSYLGAYGPATPRRFGSWISRGRIGTRSLRAWFKDLGDRVAEVDVDGELAYVRAEDVDDLAAVEASNAVRLVAGFDQWVLGPGTDDTRIIAAMRRRAVSKQSGWIAPAVLAGGVVAGTWELGEDVVRVSWFAENGRVAKKGLGTEVTRLSVILDRDLRLEVGTA
jgi:hypothetical protein